MEDKDIKTIKDLINDLKQQETITGYNAEIEIQALENLLQAYKQDKKVIEEMAKALKSYANLGVLIKCPAEYDGRYNYKNCKIDITKNRTDKTNKLCNKCIIDYFRKKCE